MNKTPSQRLRAALFILHTKSKPQLDFDSWYEEQMEKIITAVKKAIKENE